MCLYFVIRFNSLIFPLFYVIQDHITSSMESVPVYLDMDVNLYIFSMYFPSHFISPTPFHLLCTYTMHRSICVRNSSLACLFLMQSDQFFCHSNFIRVSTSYFWRNFYRVVILGLPYFCALILSNCTSARWVHPSSLS